MNILRAWKDSLSIFKPNNFQLFTLVTLKSIVDAYKIMIRYWWWLYALVIGILAYKLSIVYQAALFLANPEAFGLIYPSVLDQALFFMMTCAALLIPFFLILSVRSSVEQKNYTYFLNYLPRYFFVLCFIIIMAMIKNYILSVLTWTHYIDYLIHILIPISVYNSPFLCFYIFFLLDSNGGLSGVGRSIERAIKMVIFNFPLCFILYAVFASIEFFIGAINNFIFITLLLRTCSLITSIFICIWANIYIKKLHEQSSLYFKEPS